MALQRSVALIGAGLVSEVLYLAVTWRLPWWRYGGRIESWSKLLGGGQDTFLASLAGLGILVGVYLVGWFAVSRMRFVDDPRALRGARIIVWGGAVLFAGTLFWLLPITSDLFTYLSQAHALTDLGANPLQDALLDLAPSRLLLAYRTSYATRPSVYGPGWLLLSAPGTLGPADVATGLFYLKGLAVLAYLGSARLLESLLRQVRGEVALEGLYLFAWNPLVLLMAAGDGHNDIVMMAFVLLAFWFLLKGRWALAFGALALSTWIKYVSIVFYVPFLVYTWQSLGQRERWPALVRELLAAVATSVLLLVPIWLVDTRGEPMSEWFGGIVERLLVPGNWHTGTFALSSWLLAAGGVVFVVAYGVLIWLLARRNGLPGLRQSQQVYRKVADASFVISLLVFVLGGARSQPWYLIWPAALAGLSDRRWAWPAVSGLAAIMLGMQLWVEWGAPGWGIPG